MDMLFRGFILDFYNFGDSGVMQLEISTYLASSPVDTFMEGAFTCVANNVATLLHTSGPRITRLRHQFQIFQISMTQWRSQ